MIPSDISTTPLSDDPATFRFLVVGTSGEGPIGNVLPSILPAWTVSVFFSHIARMGTFVNLSGDKATVAASEEDRVEVQLQTYQGKLEWARGCQFFTWRPTEGGEHQKFYYCWKDGCGEKVKSIQAAVAHWRSSKHFGIPCRNRKRAREERYAPSSRPGVVGDSFWSMVSRADPDRSPRRRSSEQSPILLSQVRVRNQLLSPVVD